MRWLLLLLILVGGGWWLNSPKGRDFLQELRGEKEVKVVETPLMRELRGRLRVVEGKLNQTQEELKAELEARRQPGAKNGKFRVDTDFLERSIKRLEEERSQLTRRLAEAERSARDFGG